MTSEHSILYDIYRRHFMISNTNMSWFMLHTILQCTRNRALFATSHSVTSNRAFSCNILQFVRRRNFKLQHLKVYFNHNIYYVRNTCALHFSSLKVKWKQVLKHHLWPPDQKYPGVNFRLVQYILWERSKFRIFYLTALTFDQHINIVN